MLSDHAGWRTSMAVGSMTEEMAKLYLAEVRGKVKTTTKRAIIALKVSDYAMRQLGNRHHYYRSFVFVQGLIIDGDILAQGQAKSSLHFGFRYMYDCQNLRKRRKVNRDCLLQIL